MRKLGKLLFWASYAVVWYESWIAYQEVADILDREAHLGAQVDMLEARVHALEHAPPPVTLQRF